MNCPKCNKEIDSDSKFCEFCGEKLDYVSNDAREEMRIHKGFLFSRDKKEKPSIIKDLEKKVWYRALKIAYILGILISLFISFFYMIHEFSFWEDAVLFFLVYFFAVFILFESIKRSFYYIYFGKSFLKEGFFPFKSKE